MDEEIIIKFGMAITGHDEDTIKQMLADFMRSQNRTMHVCYLPKEDLEHERELKRKK
jgi:hypothetical protein